MTKGKFITLEGCDGCGKTTQTEMLKGYLDTAGIDYVFTREPGGGKISEAIRSLILDGKNAEMTDECEALLYAAARVQHLHDTVAPALEAGKLVICDRYYDSSFAYQGEGRGLRSTPMRSEISRPTPPYSSIFRRKKRSCANTARIRTIVWNLRAKRFTNGCTKDF